MRKAYQFSWLTAALALLVFAPGEARALGGAFGSEGADLAVTRHRVAISLSVERTVVWDQMKVSGKPSELAWIMPVLPGSRIEVATDAWLESLDAVTQVDVARPSGVECKRQFQFMCAADDMGASAEVREIAAIERAVNVVHEGTVGPFETTTLAKAGDVKAWLTEADLAISPEAQSALDAYESEGFNFIGLLLQPGKTALDMKPVRVITPGSHPVLPLRITAAGAGEVLPVTLFVIAEERMAVDGEGGRFVNVRVPLDLLAWDFEARTSNYNDLRSKTLRSVNGGAAWLTTYAQRRSLLSPVDDPLKPSAKLRYGLDRSSSPMETIADVYLNQGVLNGEAGTKVSSGEIEACAEALRSIEFKELADGVPFVNDPCPGMSLGDPACAGEIVDDPLVINGRRLMCGALDDLAVALIGMHPDSVVVTRLEADLLRSSRGADLTLVPSDSLLSVPNLLRARVSVNAETFCEDAALAPGPAVGRSRGGRGSGAAGALFVGWFGALALAAAVGRRITRQGWASRAAAAISPSPSP